MSTTAAPGRLLISADLRVEVDTATVDITADGNDELDIVVSDVARVVRALITPGAGGAVGLRRAAAFAAERLDESGLSATVRSPSGPLVVVGRRSEPGRLGRLVTGSRHLQLVRPRAWAGVVASFWRLRTR